jgi:hypothetical protein
VRLRKGLALGVAALGVLGLILVISGASGGVRGFIKDRYERAGGDRGAEVYPAAVAKEIADAHAPADRRATPEGVFLRYRDDFVGVTPEGQGSRITVADEDRGYALFFPFVGGYWGRYSGPAETFRGGGPGGGGK